MRRMKSIAFFFTLFEQATNGIACMGKIINISKQNETPKFSLIRTVHLFLTSLISFFFFILKKIIQHEIHFNAFQEEAWKTACVIHFQKKNKIKEID